MSEDSRETLDPALERAARAASEAWENTPEGVGHDEEWRRVASAVLATAGDTRRAPDEPCGDHLSTGARSDQHWCTKPFGHRGWHADGSGCEWRTTPAVQPPADPPPPVKLEPTAGVEPATSGSVPGALRPGSRTPGSDRPSGGSPELRRPAESTPEPAGMAELLEKVGADPALADEAIEEVRRHREQTAGRGLALDTEEFVAEASSASGGGETPAEPMRVVPPRAEDVPEVDRRFCQCWPNVTAWTTCAACSGPSSSPPVPDTDHPGPDPARELLREFSNLAPLGDPDTLAWRPFAQLVKRARALLNGPEA